MIPFRCAVIGARGVGAAHVRELVDAQSDSVTIIGRSEKSAHETAVSLTESLGFSLDFATSLESLKNLGINFASVCSPTPSHLRHCMSLLEMGCFVLVEKPLFWETGLGKADIEATCDRLLDSSGGRLAVNHSMPYLVKSFIDAAGPMEPIAALDFRYYTRGKARREEIAIDLLPHAISFMLAFLQPEEAAALRISNAESQISETKYQCRFRAGSIICSFDFDQSTERQNSELSFSIDGVKATRAQEFDGTRYRVFLDVSGEGNQRYAVKNPMSQSISDAIQTAKAGGNYVDQQPAVRTTMKIMSDLLLG